MNLVVIGLSITSSWGNGHATTYRALLAAFAARGHRVTFLERDVPWYSSHRDVREMPGIEIVLYHDLAELRGRHAARVTSADAVIVGSYVPEGVAVGEWVTAVATGVVAFYDIDTPVTLAKVARGDFEYISPELIRRYPLYLSFTGGRTLQRLERDFGSPMARALYCAVEPSRYFPEEVEAKWDLGYLGTFSEDRQPALERLLVQPAEGWPEGRFVVAGPQYPPGLRWPSNVERMDHLPPAEHRRFYNEQRFTLNLTRADMIAAGHSPSVRLFEAAACGTPIISDRWDGIDTLFTQGREILLVDDREDVLRALREMTPAEAAALGKAARERVLEFHTAAHRAAELEQHLLDRMRTPLPASVA